MSTPEDSRRFGPYRLLHPLGAGGMGQVFLARHSGEHEIQRVVALKRILNHLSQEKRFVQLFLDEVRVAAQLHHGAIVQVIDHGCIDGQYYMAMEYVHGENLSVVLERLRARGQRLPADLALHIAAGVCEGLDYAHRKQSIDGRPLEIVHRDVTPHNVMLSFEGEVKIADFGVARAAEQTHQTLGGELRGKVIYMSPEQAYGRELDQRSDIFSLGVVLYESLAGANPFLRDNVLASLEAVRSSSRPPLAHARPDLPDEVVELVEHALATDPSERPPSARAMHEALQRVMRLHTMVVSSFDLADYLFDLFPESREIDGEDVADGATMVGRRADGLEPSAAPHDDLARKSLFYLRRRRLSEEAERVSQALVPAHDRQQVEPFVDQTSSVPRRAGTTMALVVVLGGAMLGLGGWWIWGRETPSSHSASVDGAPGIGMAPRLISGRADLARHTPPRESARVSARALERADASVLLRRSLRGDHRGHLFIETRPSGASLVVDGASRGRTPQRVRLAPGPHRVALRLEGHRPQILSVRIASGRRTRRRVVLVPLTTLLRVTSTKPCRATIGGREVGLTPQTRPVAAGRVVVRCRDSARGIDARRVIRVIAGRRAELRFAFGALAINVDPWARVRVDGRAVGSTPLRLSLSTGEHRVELLNAPAGRRKRLTVEIAKDATKHISSW